MVLLRLDLKKRKLIRQIPLRFSFVRFVEKNLIPIKCKVHPQMKAGPPLYSSSSSRYLNHYREHLEDEKPDNHCDTRHYACHVCSKRFSRSEDSPLSSSIEPLLLLLSVVIC